MSSTSSPDSSILVDSDETLQLFLQDINDDISSGFKILFIDLEGINLCRHGSISILTLLVHDTRSLRPDTVYLIDITTLGFSAFTTPLTTSALPDFRTKSQTFQQILESQTIRKVIFDVRNDSDALFALFGIRLQCVTDLQLMSHASRVARRKPNEDLSKYRVVFGLAKCIRLDGDMSKEEKKDWEDVKDSGRKLFAPEIGGKYEVFNERPLKKEMRDYCVQDVARMPGLYRVYRERIESVEHGDGLLKLVEKGTEKRLEESRSEGYEPNGRDKALAPEW